MQCQTDSETSTTTVHDIEPDGTEVARWQGGAAVLPPGGQFQLTGRFVPGEHGAQMGDLVERYRRTGHIHPRFDPLAHEPRPMAGSDTCASETHPPRALGAAYRCAHVRA
jgi:hypothetical protein